MRSAAKLLLCCAALCAALLAFGVQDRAAAQFNTMGTFCTRAKIYDASTNGATVLVAGGGSIQICGYQIWAGGTATVDLEYGTGSTCATGTVKITPAWSLAAQTGVADTSANFRGLSVPPSNDLCIHVSAGVAVQAIVYYTQAPSF